MIGNPKKRVKIVVEILTRLTCLVQAHISKRTEGRINLAKDEPTSRFLLCRNCGRKQFLYTARRDVTVEYEMPKRLDIDTGDVVASIQIKCSRCKVYNSAIFRDETLAARPPSVYEHSVIYDGAHNK
jgi:hypothetical protein